MAILLHIPKRSATVLRDIIGYVTCSHNVTHDGKNNYDDFVTYPEVHAIQLLSASGYVTKSPQLFFRCA